MDDRRWGREGARLTPIVLDCMRLLCSSIVCRQALADPADRGYDERGLDEVGGDVVRQALGSEQPLGLVAVVHQHRPAAGPAARLDVVEDIANDPGAAKVQVMLAGCLEYEAGPRLAAVAVNGVTLLAALRVVGAIVEAVQGHGGLCQQA